MGAVAPARCDRYRGAHRGIRLARTVRRPRDRRRGCVRGRGRVRQPGSRDESRRRTACGTDTAVGVDDVDRRRHRSPRRASPCSSCRVRGSTIATACRPAGLGFVATGFGAAELVASMSAAAFSDRIGLRRSVLIGLGVLGLGLADRRRVRTLAGARDRRADRLPHGVRVRVRHVVVVGDRGRPTGARTRDRGRQRARDARQVGGRPRQRAALRRCRHRWLVGPVSRRGDDRRRPHRVRYRSPAKPTLDARSTIAAATAAACVFGPKWRASATSTTWQSGSSRAR